MHLLNTVQENLTSEQNEVQNHKRRQSKQGFYKTLLSFQMSEVSQGLVCVLFNAHESDHSFKIAQNADDVTLFLRTESRDENIGKLKMAEDPNQLHEVDKTTVETSF